MCLFILICSLLFAKPHHRAVSVHIRKSQFFSVGDRRRVDLPGDGGR